MKRIMSLEELKEKCGHLVDSYIRKFDPDEIVAVVRGGMVPASIIAKMVRKPVGVFYPKTKEYFSPEYIRFREDRPFRIAIIEDLVALGRTKDIVQEVFGNESDIEFMFLPILVDSEYQGKVDGYSMKTSDWIVFPWEDTDCVVEGDRGLFRDRSDKYNAGI